MNAIIKSAALGLVILITSGIPARANAQVPVGDDGRAMADYEPLGDAAASGNEDIPLLEQSELQDLVGPIALYPDDLLAIVLPASTYPLQLVQAQRFLQALENDPSLVPDEEWDDSVVALLNYPEVVDLLNEDLDWTWRLGEAVVAQQADVVAAVESFRDRAYAAGNLTSDSHQRVTHDEGAIEIAPVEDDIIYVPYYEPNEVVVYQTRPVYYYYPRAYPVYYYPYPDTYAFHSGFFWGVTTAFTVGWLTDSVHVVHHSYHGHPYYGHRYWDGWWYRRPTVHVHNHYYGGAHYATYRHRYTRGDYWRPRYESRRRLSNQRITRSTYYANRDRHTSTVSRFASNSSSPRQATTRGHRRTNVASTSAERRTTRPTTTPRVRSVSQQQRSVSQQQRRPQSRSAGSQRPARQDADRSRDRRETRLARRDVVQTTSPSADRRRAASRSAEVQRHVDSRPDSRNARADRTSARRTEQRREANPPRERSNRRSASESGAERRESRGSRGGGSKSRASRRQRH